MQGRKQTINFGEDCTWGNLAHEFMHSLGKDKMYPKVTCTNNTDCYYFIIDTLFDLELYVFLFSGFFHEHTRSDRDKYMTVNWDNIKKYEKETGRTWEHNFKKCTIRGCNDLKVGYDYESIMHYGKNLGRYPVLIPKEKNVYIGQRNHLSEKDIEGLNEHYCSSGGPSGKGKIHHNCRQCFQINNSLYDSFLFVMYV